MAPACPQSGLEDAVVAGHGGRVARGRRPALGATAGLVDEDGPARGR
ncbi:MAG: hypothetical protein M0C28_38195 [Candidatus Moduliflexus flocculans]|nr:hypothetical protein [Candidatus Moduliflexus flocculans]